MSPDKKTEPPQIPISAEIEEYVKKLYKEGNSDEDIRKELAERGFPEDTLDKINSGIIDEPNRKEPPNLGRLGTMLLVMGVIFFGLGFLSNSAAGGVPPVILFILGLANILAGVYYIVRARQ